MNKQAFLSRLRKGLSSLPRETVGEALTFCSEIIDDRIEAGMSEEEAVAKLGSPDNMIRQILGDHSQEQRDPAPENKKRTFPIWLLVIVILGAPIWLSLGISAVAVILSLYLSLWAVVISSWSVFVSLISCSISALVMGVISLWGGYTASGLPLIGCSLVCAGLGIFLFFGCGWATRKTVLLAKKFVLFMKNLWKRKEAV